ncbi:MAG: DUF5131 family protein [Thermoleophilia bacterium]
MDLTILLRKGSRIERVSFVRWRFDRFTLIDVDKPSCIELVWPRNIWMGVTIEDNEHLGRVERLREVPSAVRFLSIEPLLGRLPALNLDGIDWVIVGGESGPAARPMHESWVLEIRDACLDGAVPFFFKQWGGTRKKAAGRELESRKWSEMPCRPVGVA